MNTNTPVAEFKWDDDKVLSFVKFTQKKDRDRTGYYTDLEDFKRHHSSSGKPVLFTTEDLVDIFIGDSYWCVRDNWFVAACNTADYNLAHKVKRFSTEAVANEYVLMNKPVLSLKMVMDVVCTISNGAKGYDNKIYLRDRLRELTELEINPF